MKVLAAFLLIGAASAAGPYLVDLLKPALNVAEVQAILAQSQPGVAYPNYRDLPQTNFDCNSKKQPGFYADQDAQCQVFHRCDINGNHTAYLCVNTTVFNQLTLICDYFFNVDCTRSKEFEDFANSRLYRADLPLFDTKPERPQTVDNAIVVSAPVRRPAPRPVAVKKAAAATTSTAAPDSTEAADNGAQASGEADAGSQ